MVLSWEEAQTTAEIEELLSSNYRKLQKLYQKGYLDHFLMVKPDNFDIPLPESAAGNDFLEQGSKKFDKATDGVTAIASWKSYKKSLKQLGARVTTMPANDGLVDQVFRADPSLSVRYIGSDKAQAPSKPDIHIISNFTHPERVTESQHAKSFLKKIIAEHTPATPWKVNIVEAEHHIEGSGDNLIDPIRGIILSGKGMRNQEGAAQELSEKTGLPVFEIETKAPFFHVDTFVALLPTGHVIYAEDVMSEQGKKQLDTALFKNNPAIKQHYGIPVSKDLAQAFFCNLVPIGANKLAVQPPHPDMVYDNGTSFEAAQKEYARVKTILHNLGYQLSENDTHLFNLAGGGLHCMINKINHPVIDRTQTKTPQFVKDILKSNSKANDAAHSML